MLKTSDIREGQVIMEAILKDIDVFCKENNLKYWLIYGTLLGAVRHKGFIPWDDDIDIGMLREDYNKLEELFKNNKIQDKYKLLTEKSSKNYPYSFYKISSRENFCDWNGTEDDKGIFLDIFPFDMYTKEAVKYLDKLCFNRKMIAELLNERRKEKNYFIRRIITLKREILKIKNYFLRIKLKKYQTFNKGKYIFNDLSIKTVNFYNFTEIFPLKKLFFETQEYYVPNNWDAYLKKVYGNYMQLPPIEKRKSEHPIGHFYIKKSIINNG